MSVALLIDYEGTEKRGYVPIAAESTFTEHWQPACAKLGLQWVPQFQFGLPIEDSYIPNILNELEQLRNYLINKVEGNLEDTIEGHLVIRIDLLTPALKEIQDDPKMGGYIV